MNINTNSNEVLTLTGIIWFSWNIIFQIITENLQFFFLNWNRQTLKNIFNSVLILIIINYNTCLWNEKFLRFYSSSYEYSCRYIELSPLLIIYELGIPKLPYKLRINIDYSYNLQFIRHTCTRIKTFIQWFYSIILIAVKL